ncbi:hypothetical protein [Rhizobium leguminosarum]|uniref:hypothetical protein n=1 Tax=Rhizobium leguminosarum TaxID=384 RepID=UPI0021BC24BD|nr:hypothetical protein [Rhizobium leguminosarum]
MAASTPTWWTPLSASPGKAVGLAIYSALAAATHKLATTDAIISLTAARHDADILTCDGISRISNTPSISIKKD